MVSQFLFIVFLLSTLVQLFFWGYFFSRLAFYRPSGVRSFPGEENETPVSIIICAHNEAENLRKNLNHFLSQNYRSFEIIVVNDHSSDKTLDVLLEFQIKNPKLRVVSVKEKFLPGKKSALSLGIDNSHYSILLLTDADCKPASFEWLKIMQAVLRGETKIALGYSPFIRKPGLLNRFIRFEGIYTATQYLSFALTGYPYMGVGRNLAYTKSLYFHNGGFNKHLDLISGDDDLFINQVANRKNTKIILDPGSFIYTEPKSTWRGYYNQKRRHLTTGRRYRPLHQFLLGALSASHAGHYVAGLALLFSGDSAIIVLLIYLVRMGVVSWLYYRIMHKLQDSILWPWTPLLDAAFVLYYFLFAPVLLTGNVKKWK